MDIVYTDASGKDVGILKSAKLECAFGSGENDFELVLDASQGITLEQGGRVYVEGTEYGGVVDSYEYDSSESRISYSGRSIHGILVSRIISPDLGADYYKVDGEINSVLATLISRCGLDSLIKVSNKSTGVWATYQFDRYCNSWDGIRDLLAQASMRPEFVWQGKTVTLQAASTVSHAALDTDLLDHDFTHVFRPVNHLICLGSGELRNRVVIHLFADASGRVSKTQTLFGLDEVVATYDSNNSGAQELEKNGIKKLKELQDASSLDITLKSDADFALGDSVTSYDATTGAEITASIEKKIVTITGDAVSIEYKVGGGAKGTSLSGGSSSSSGGGIVYSAGEGISISNATISADVTLDKLNDVKAQADSAKAAASEASATSGKALAVANTAIQSADVSEQITASRTQNNLTIGHAPSGVTAGSYGVASTYQYPGFGTSVVFPQTLVVDAQGHVTSVQKGYAKIPSTEATQSASGLLSASDKAKLDGIAHGANAYVLPAATLQALGGVKPDGITITVGTDGTISAQAGGAAAFLAAWPVGSIYSSSKPVSPATQYGGHWKELPSMESFKWERIA